MKKTLHDGDMVVPMGSCMGRSTLSRQLAGAGLRAILPEASIKEQTCRKRRCLYGNNGVKYYRRISCALAAA